MILIRLIDSVQSPDISCASKLPRLQPQPISLKQVFVVDDENPPGFALNQSDE